MSQEVSFVAHSNLSGLRFRAKQPAEWINQHSNSFHAAVHTDFTDECLESRIIVGIKLLPSLEQMLELQRQGKIVILDMVDAPVERFQEYYSHLNAVIAVSPYQKQLLQGANVVCIEHHLENTQGKRRQPQEQHRRIVWMGFHENFRYFNKALDAMQKLTSKNGYELVAVCNQNPSTNPWRYVPYDIATWEDVLVTADIGILARKDIDYMRTKPCLKAALYMAAGLPVVALHPSDADKSLIDDGKTGFNTFNKRQFIERLRQIMTDAKLGEAMSRTAHDEAWKRYHPDVILPAYIQLFNQVGA